MPAPDQSSSPRRTCHHMSCSPSRTKHVAPARILMAASIHPSIRHRGSTSSSSSSSSSAPPSLQSLSSLLLLLPLLSSSFLFVAKLQDGGLADRPGGLVCTPSHSTAVSSRCGSRSRSFHFTLLLIVAEERKDLRRSQNRARVERGARDKDS